MPSPAPSAQPLSSLAAPWPGSASRLLRSRVWDQVCRHIDGVAIGSTIAALHERGGTQVIAERERTLAGDLRRRLGANAGYMHVAIRLLADQGWVTCTGETGTDALVIEPTTVGRAVLTQLADGYPLAVRFLPLAEQIEGLLLGEATSRTAERDLGAFVDLMRREWYLPPQALPIRARHQVVSHLDGHLVAPVMSALARHGKLGAGTGIRLDDGRSRGRHALMRLAAQILAGQGWVTIDGDLAHLTPAGAVAAICAQQYWYPVTYLATLRRVPELIFGDPGRAWTAVRSEDEGHLDRKLDIRFSGDVFTATCQAPFLEIVLPLFDRPTETQPAMVVDAGCGDGTMLEALYTAVQADTGRGLDLADHPLLMVGVEPSLVARRTASARLRAAGIPHLIIDGDIADPESLGRRLSALGMDAGDALHVSKSVIHDRAYQPPGGTEPITSAPPPSSGAFALPDGTAIPPAKMATSLAELFRSWRPFARQHGLVVIEAHAAPPATIAGLIGRTLATALDATHGYSCQYPVEPEVFAWAARAAGLRSRRHRDLGAATVGHTLLTIDHFIVEGLV